MHPVIDDEPSLRRLELIGTLARAARLALQDHEEADAVELAVVATPEGFRVDCVILAGEVQVGGWAA